MFESCSKTFASNDKGIIPSDSSVKVLYRVGTGRARFFRLRLFSNDRINQYYLHVFSVYFPGY